MKRAQKVRGDTASSAVRFAAFLLAVGLIITFLYLLSANAFVSGNAVLALAQPVEGQVLQGDIILDLTKTGTIPLDSMVRLRLNGYSKEIPLETLVASSVAAGSLSDKAVFYPSLSVVFDIVRDPKSPVTEAVNSYCATLEPYCAGDLSVFEKHCSQYSSVCSFNLPFCSSYGAHCAAGLQVSKDAYKTYCASLKNDCFITTLAEAVALETSQRAPAQITVKEGYMAVVRSVSYAGSALDPSVITLTQNGETTYLTTTYSTSVSGFAPESSASLPLSITPFGYVAGKQGTLILTVEHGGQTLAFEQESFAAQDQKPAPEQKPDAVPSEPVASLSPLTKDPELSSELLNKGCTYTCVVDTKCSIPELSSLVKESLSLPVRSKYCTWDCDPSKSFTVQEPCAEPEPISVKTGIVIDDVRPEESVPAVELSVSSAVGEQRSETSGSSRVSIDKTVTVLNEKTQEEVASISYDPVQKRAEVFVFQGQETYPSTCYNLEKDADEGGVDCDGVCRKCAPDSTTSQTLSYVSWAAVALLSVALIIAAFMRFSSPKKTIGKRSATGFEPFYFIKK